MGFWHVYFALHGIGRGAVIDGITTRLTLVGTSKERYTLHATSQERLTVRGTSQERLTLEGSSR